MAESPVRRPDAVARRNSVVQRLCRVREEHAAGRAGQIEFEVRAAGGKMQRDLANELDQRPIVCRLRESQSHPVAEERIRRKQHAKRHEQPLQQLRPEERPVKTHSASR